MSRTLWGFPRVDPSWISIAFAPPWSTSIIIIWRTFELLWVTERKLLSPVWLFATPWTIQPLEFYRAESGRILSLLQGIFPTQGSTQVSRIADRFFPAEPPGKLSVQSLSRVQLFATPWIAAHQASLSITNSRSLLKTMSINSVMLSNHLISLSSPSPPAPNPCQHQGLFQWVNSLHEVAKVLEFQLQHQSFQWTPRTHLL